MKIDEMPKIFGADTRKVEVCTTEDLKEAGQVFTSYGIGTGESVKVPQTRDEVVVVKQPNRRVNANGERTLQYFMSIERTTAAGVKKNDWLSLGSLIRRDANQEPVDEVAKLCLQYDNIEDRINAILGKTITCKGRENRLSPKFVNNRNTGEVEERPTAIYAFA